MFNHLLSLNRQTFLSEGFLGEIEIIPRQTIQLDRTDCNTTMFTTVAPPTLAPPPVPPTPGAPYVCTRLYDIAQAVYSSTPVFRCSLKERCESGLSCWLAIAHTQYQVNIDLYSDGLGMSVTNLMGQIPYGSGRDTDVFVSLPEPTNTSLLLRQRVDRLAGWIGFSVSHVTSLLPVS